MAEDVGGDQFVIIRIDGMHCHKCEQAIQKSLTDAVTEAGYQVSGFLQRHTADPAGQPESQI